MHFADDGDLEDGDMYDEDWDEEGAAMRFAEDMEAASSSLRAMIHHGFLTEFLAK